MDGPNPLFERADRACQWATEIVTETRKLVDAAKVLCQRTVELHNSVPRPSVAPLLRVIAPR